MSLRFENQEKGDINSPADEYFLGSNLSFSTIYGGDSQGLYQPASGTPQPEAGTGASDTKSGSINEDDCYIWFGEDTADRPTHTLTPADFEKLGPKAAEVLKDFGIKEVKITECGNCDHIEASLAEPKVFEQDPENDGCRALCIDTTFAGDVRKNPDGSLVLDNIEGLYADVKVLGKWREAEVKRVALTRDQEKTLVESTGQVGYVKRTNTRERPADVIEKAELLFERFGKIKDDLKAESREKPASGADETSEPPSSSDASGVRSKTESVCNTDPKLQELFHRINGQEFFVDTMVKDVAEGEGQKKDTPLDSAPKGVSPHLKAMAMIQQFGDDEYKVRQGAWEEVVDMGDDAMPTLKGIDLSKQELEVRYRVMSAIREIEARKFEKRFQEYEKHVPVMEKLFDKAGFHFVSDHVKIDDKGHTLASIKLHPPAQGLTAEDRAMFESAIEFGDKLRTDPKDFQDLKDNTEDSGDYYKLRLVDHSMRARELYARALVDSQKPGDLEKAFQLLSEQIKVTPDFSPSESFLDTAWLLLRIDDNPDFRKAFSDAGLDQQSIKPLLVGRMWEF